MWKNNNFSYPWHSYWSSHRHKTWQNQQGRDPHRERQQRRRHVGRPPPVSGRQLEQRDVKQSAGSQALHYARDNGSRGGRSDGGGRLDERDREGRQETPQGGHGGKKAGRRAERRNLQEEKAQVESNTATYAVILLCLKARPATTISCCAALTRTSPRDAAWH